MFATVIKKIQFNYFLCLLELQTGILEYRCCAVLMVMKFVIGCFLHVIISLKFFRFSLLRISKWHELRIELVPKLRCLNWHLSNQKQTFGTCYFAIFILCFSRFLCTCPNVFKNAKSKNVFDFDPLQIHPLF